MRRLGRWLSHAAVTGLAGLVALSGILSQHSYAKYAFRRHGGGWPTTVAYYAAPGGVPLAVLGGALLVLYWVWLRRLTRGAFVSGALLVASTLLLGRTIAIDLEGRYWVGYFPVRTEHGRLVGDMEHLSLDANGVELILITDVDHVVCYGGLASGLIAEMR